MPVRKPASKVAKGKKPASRPAARKASQRKAATERTKSVHARKPVAAARKAATPHRAAHAAAAEPVSSRRVNDTAAAPSAKVSPAPPTPLAPISAFRPSTAPALEGEDADSVESLLAGPRDVQPYIVKRGELYMSKEQLEHFRHILLVWKRDLMVEVDRTVSHMKDEAANFPDPNDRATQEEEFSLELRTRDRERKLIRKIDDALKRIEDGTYGYCLETGEEIGIKRLEARPVATLTLEAQERRERREKQYGDRDDRYR
jgi:DnaK suppressor protein